MIIEILLLIITAISLIILWKISQLKKDEDFPKALEEKHRQMLVDINDALNKLSDRLHKTLSDQGKTQQETVQSSLKNTSLQLMASVESLTKTVDKRLQEITGKVHERLEEGFKKTNATFVSVMERLATIDEAQKKIDGLSTNMVSLQELLGDKRSRGAFGELQLEGLIKNILPPDSFSFQHTFKGGARADCVLFFARTNRDRCC